MSATSVFFVVDFFFWASNLLKLADGGWFPLVIAGAVLALMLTWRDGRELLNQKQRQDALSLSDFLDAVFVAPPVRVPGTAVFLTADADSVPNAMLHNLKHNKVLHEPICLFLWSTTRCPGFPWTSAWWWSLWDTPAGA